MNYVNLSENGLEFKNIVSGPAPVGRILNYIKLIGKDKLKHKNGYRSLDLSNSIGYAWTTEFMFGLGLIYSDEKEENDKVIQLKLTDNGKKLFKFIDDKGDINFDENNDSECKQQVLDIGFDFYNCFKEVFINSVIYKNLQIYIMNRTKNSFDKSTFKDDYFNELYSYYTGKVGENNSEGATTGGNRVPSMIDLCKFFDLANEGKNNYYFYGDLNRKYANSNINNEFKRNRIIFGAPGTGKSFKLNNEKDQLVQNDEQYERVTFHPDYTYANFVGTYKPVMTNSNEIINQNDKEIIEVLNDKSISAQEKYDKLYDKFKDDNSLTRLSILIGLYDGGDFVAKKADGSDAAKSSVEKNHGKAIKPYVNLINNNTSDNISYKYIPGPFMRLFVKALLNPDKPYLLLIEEINRANVAAVFGDLFQLLDRDNNEESEYPVEASEDIKKYLQEYKIERSKIKIPSNMFIWATMNSADQGVFPMDTAFKRRWDFDYIGINNNEDSIKDKEFIIDIENKNGKIVGSPLNWNLIRKAINKYLSDNKINEDKQLGAYFISKKVLFSGDDREFISVFKNKVLMYLFEDAAKQKRTDIFAGASSKGYDSNRYSSICECFDEYGIECFNTSIQKDYIEKIAEKGYN